MDQCQGLEPFFLKKIFKAHRIKLSFLKNKAKNALSDHLLINR
jgi:hypothetical protein